jgi:hypothetical protein
MKKSLRYRRRDYTPMKTDANENATFPPYFLTSRRRHYCSLLPPSDESVEDGEDGPFPT